MVSASNPWLACVNWMTLAPKKRPPAASKLGWQACLEDATVNHFQENMTLTVAIASHRSCRGEDKHMSLQGSWGGPVWICPGASNDGTMDRWANHGTCHVLVQHPWSDLGHKQVLLKILELQNSPTHILKIHSNTKTFSPYQAGFLDDFCRGCINCPPGPESRQWWPGRSRSKGPRHLDDHRIGCCFNLIPTQQTKVIEIYKSLDLYGKKHVPFDIWREIVLSIHWDHCEINTVQLICRWEDDSKHTN